MTYDTDGTCVVRFLIQIADYFLSFFIGLLLACGFSAAKAKIEAALFSLTIGRRLTRVCFTVPKRQKMSANRLKAMCDFWCLSLLLSTDVNNTLSMCIIMGIVRNEKKWK